MEIALIIFAILFLGIVIGMCMNILWLGFAAVLYFVPTIIAAYKKHPHTLWIFLVNLFFGCTVIGWIIAFLWALDFDKVITDFIEFRKEKYSTKDTQGAQNSKDTENTQNSTIEGEIVSDENNS